MIAAGVVAGVDVGKELDSYDGILLQLAHEPTIQRNAKQIREGYPNWNGINRSLQQRLIELFEESLLIAEPAVPSGRGGDIPPQSDSAGTARSMLARTHESREIPPQARVWARALYGIMLKNVSMNPSDAHVARTDQARAIVRNWWREKQSSVQSAGGDKVKPGAIHSQLAAANTLESENPAATPTPSPTAAQKRRGTFDPKQKTTRRKTLAALYGRRAFGAARDGAFSFGAEECKVAQSGR